MIEQPDQSLVYFVQIGKHIKIGFTTDLARRLKAFATTAVETKILLTVAGNRELERSLHGWFHEARITRELFRYDWRIQGFIDNVQYDGIACGMRYLHETSPARLAARRQERDRARIQQRRQSRAELDAIFAAMVAERKQRIGW